MARPGLNECHRYGVIDVVPRKQFEEHMQRETLAGRKIKPIDSKWSDTNKGTESEPDMRSRLCAREIKRLQVLGVSEIAGNASDLFASKPPVDAIRMIFSLLMSRTRVQHWQEPESETVRHQKSILQRVSSTRAFVL